MHVQAKTTRRGVTVYLVLTAEGHVLKHFGSRKDLAEAWVRGEIYA